MYQIFYASWRSTQRTQIVLYVNFCITVRGTAAPLKGTTRYEWQRICYLNSYFFLLQTYFRNWEEDSAKGLQAKLNCKNVTIAVGKLKVCCHLLVDNTKLVVHYFQPYVSRSASGFQLGTWYIRVFSLSGIQYSGLEKYHLTLELNEILHAQTFKKGNT